MAWRRVMLLAVGCYLSCPVFAGDAVSRPEIKHRMSCVLVRYYVAKYTAAAAEAYARSKGAPDADIDAARRCLPPTVTARGGL